MATAQELMEQNQELSQAVDGLAEATLEEQVLAKLKEIEAILTKLDGESIDLSVFLEQIQSFSDEKKAELQALVDKVDNPLGEKTITFETCKDTKLYDGAIVWQEVWMKDGAITKYGDVFVMGTKAFYTVGGGANSPARLNLPSEVEFDLIVGWKDCVYARPKAGQSNLDGVSGSLDNFLYCIGNAAQGAIGNGSTVSTKAPFKQSFDSRVKKILARGYSVECNYAMVILENNDLYATGYNSFGAFGNGNTAQINSWTRLDTGVLNVWGMHTNAYFLKTNGLYSAGKNEYGCLGIGSTSASTTKALAKSFSDPNAEVKTSFYYDGSGNYYTNAFVFHNGRLYGTGWNAYNNISSSDTTNKSSFVEVISQDGQNMQDAKFLPLHAGLATLKPNSSGGMDLYVAGRGDAGYGDGTSGSTTKPLRKIKSFEGNDWEFINWSECINQTWNTYKVIIYSKKKKEAWAFGGNANGSLGVGLQDTNIYGLTKVLLPKSIKQLEFCGYFYNTIGSLCVIADGVIYACGITTGGRVAFETPILNPQRKD